MSKKEAKRPPLKSPYRHGKTREEVNSLWSQWSENAPSDEFLRRSAGIRNGWSKIEVKTKASQSQRQALDNTDLAQRRAESLRKSLATPEARFKKSEASRAALANPESRKKISTSLKEVLSTKEARMKKSEAAKKGLSTEKAKANLSKAQKIANSRQEVRDKKSAALAGRPKPKLSCPHCNKEGGRPQMLRYHFDNCKHKA